jgi:hypothetical protein
MRVQAGLSQAPIFNPIVGNFLKGLAVTVPVYPSLLSRKADAEAILDIYRKHYEGEQFVRVHPFNSDANLDNGFFDVQASNDTNRVDRVRQRRTPEPGGAPGQPRQGCGRRGRAMHERPYRRRRSHGARCLTSRPLQRKTGSI